MRLKHYDSFCLESIRFQSGTFFKELALNVTEIRKTAKPSTIQNHDGIVAIEKCIQHHTGLNIRLAISVNGPAIDIPRLDKNHPFIQDYLRSYLDDQDVFRMMKDSKGVISGTVDLISGKVSGVFSEIVSTLYMPDEFFLTDKYTPEETAAILLHEVGHPLTYYEFLNRSVSTNQVLSALSRGIAEADTVAKREQLIISAQKALSLKESGVEELSKSKDGKVVSCVILSQVVEKTRSELGNNIYDITSWEYLADEFAARHQAGRHLVTGLDKLYRSYNNKSFRSTPTFLGFEALKLLLLLGGIFSGLVFTVAMGSILIAADSDPANYDTPEARIRRIRNQLTEALKDRKLNDDDSKRIQEDLKVIDAVAKDVDDRRQFFGVMYDWLSPTGRRNRKEIILQRELETIAANELFEKAAQFKTLKV